MKAKLENLLTQAEIQLTDLQKDQLIQLVQLLNKWNKAYNLTSVRDPQSWIVLLLVLIYKEIVLLMWEPVQACQACL